ncbi:hypothetical protein HYFRA_00011692 [Hymenoscyphus fraxineus]|uniref:2EXR domain-containing protein n=1 Tax=Hymenoscyphus fraxineus TaxID=746836 RepID=A0A9N9PUN6_9HELO|nr:hypothetical protein HYFRA_00011692 [Hymenoscyphus fraxineus]
MTSIDLPENVGWHHHAAVGLVVRVLRLLIFLENKITKAKEQTANPHLSTSSKELKSKSQSKIRVKLPIKFKTKNHTQEPSARVISTEPTFTRFNDLPLELRLRIWSLASSVPRVVEVRQPHQRIIRNSVSQFNLLTLTFVDSWLLGAPRVYSPVPAVLHTCQESRHEALRHYTLSLAMKDNLAAGKGSYVNFKKDMLYFGIRSSFFCLNKSMNEGVLHGFERVEHLALGTNALGYEGDMWWFDLEKFASLKSICFLFKEPRFLNFAGREGITLVSEGVKLPGTEKARRWSEILSSLESQIRVLELREMGYQKPRFLAGAFKGVKL